MASFSKPPPLLLFDCRGFWFRIPLNSKKYGYETRDTDNYVSIVYHAFHFLLDSHVIYLCCCLHVCLWLSPSHLVACFNAPSYRFVYLFASFGNRSIQFTSIQFNSIQFGSFHSNKLNKNRTNHPFGCPPPNHLVHHFIYLYFPPTHLPPPLIPVHLSVDPPDASCKS